MNTIIVRDIYNEDLVFTPSEGYEIEMNYRNDGSLSVFAINEDGTIISLGEFARDHWERAILQGEE